ncbi:HAMP domain-containing histidine kinase [Paucibacter sp. TC2R-5]|uniref:sensor histidine kinase n=1 Tax=Paucibacter sp. TC2R-5 TaxID=2893555 RepID=UPI0021E3BA37|nr:HAMP domain-containing sensor histidine kinase [Paucibacter sp. TC2R-5]MCV2361208.1 HAMP domain-containing histidine kinase [Paucibacter sp. TC2R-5]
MEHSSQDTLETDKQQRAELLAIQLQLTRMELKAASAALAHFEQDTAEGEATPANALFAQVLILLMRLRADIGAADSALLEQALELARAAAALPNEPLIEAAALHTLALLQARMRMHHGALTQLSRAYELTQGEGEAELADAIQNSRATVLTLGEMFEDLLSLAEQILPRRSHMTPLSVHRLLVSAATACFVLADEQMAPAGAPLWLSCKAMHEDALSVAVEHGLATSALASHLNLSFVESLVGDTAQARLHLDALNDPAVQEMREQFAGAGLGIELSRRLIEWRERGSAVAWQQVLAFEMELRNQGGATKFVREYALRSIARHGQAAGDAGAAVQASHSLLDVYRQRMRAISATLSTAVQDVVALQHSRIENEQLTRQGNRLEQSLAARNAELSQTLARLQTEASIRRAAEAALQQANEELEARVAARTHELEQASRALAQQEKQLALGRMVVGMAHELNTPLGNARMGASVIHDRAIELELWLNEGQVRRQALTETASSLQQCSSLVDRSLESATALVQRLKALSSDSAQESAQDFDVCSLMRNTLAQQQARLDAAGVCCKFDMPTQLPMHGPMHALGDVLKELLDNAIEHGLKQADDPQLKVSLQVQQDSLVLRLRDNGCGISAEALPRIFDPFYSGQLGRSGAGLGLSVVRMLVEEMLHGQIAVQSQLGLGTQVELTLPLR